MKFDYEYLKDEFFPVFMGKRGVDYDIIYDKLAKGKSESLIDNLVFHWKLLEEGEYINCRILVPKSNIFVSLTPLGRKFAENLSNVSKETMEKIQGHSISVVTEVMHTLSKRGE